MTVGGERRKTGQETHCGIEPVVLNMNVCLIGAAQVFNVACWKNELPTPHLKGQLEVVHGFPFILSLVCWTTGKKLFPTRPG